MTSEELIEKIENAFLSGCRDINVWQSLEEDILEYLKHEENPIERRRFVPLGYLEMVSMMADPTGYEKEKG